MNNNFKKDPSEEIPIPETPSDPKNNWAEPRNSSAGHMGGNNSKEKEPMLPTKSYIPKYCKPPVQQEQKSPIEKIKQILNTDFDSDLLNNFLSNVKIDEVLDVQYTTVLHIAVRKNAIVWLGEFLEKVPKDLIDSPTLDGFTPLHIAAKKLNKNAIEKLLEKGACPNARNEAGNSPLHLVLLELETKNVSTEEVKSCMELLINNLETDLDAVNAKKETPIELLNKIQTDTDLTELSTKLLESRSRSRSRSTSAKFYDCLARNEEDANIWNEILTNDEETVKALAKGFYGANRMLNHVVLNTVAMEFFLDKLNVNPAIENLNDTIPLHKSLSYNDYKTTDILIKKMASNTWKEKCQDQKNRSFSLIKNAIDGAKKNDMNCLERLLDGNILLDINGEEKGSTTTALTYAAQMNNQDAMSVLIAHGSYLGSSAKNDQRSVLHAVQRKTLIKAMDKCVSFTETQQIKEENSDNIVSEDYALKLNYKFLLPNYKEDDPKCNEVTSLYEIGLDKNLRASLKHPLIQIFLHAKWLGVRPFFIIHLLLYLLLILMLTSFFFFSKNVRMIEMELDNENATTINSTHLKYLEETLCTNKALRDTMRVLVLLLTVYIFLKEIHQFCTTRKNYLKRLENRFEILLIVAIIITCTVPWSIEATRHLGAWTMILAWCTFVLALGRLPSLSIYIKLLRHVSWNFLKLIFLFGFLVIAFGVSFNIITSSNYEFLADLKDFITIIPRAIVMATGEFEFTGFNERKDISSLGFWETLSTVFLFLLFIFLIFLVLMNLMTGLAVTDSKELFDDAVLYSLLSRLELIHQNEEFAGWKLCKTRFIRRFNVLDHKSRTLMVYPNREDKSKRILITSGRRFDEETNGNYRSLDNETADLLRSYRLKMINEKNEN